MVKFGKRDQGHWPWLVYDRVPQNAGILRAHGFIKAGESVEPAKVYYYDLQQRSAVHVVSQALLTDYSVVFVKTRRTSNRKTLYKFNAGVLNSESSQTELKVQAKKNKRAELLNKTAGLYKNRHIFDADETAFEVKERAE